jgi:hypothetical protein
MDEHETEVKTWLEDAAEPNSLEGLMQNEEVKALLEDNNLQDLLQKNNLEGLLQSDTLQEALRDPELLKMLQSGDVSGLLQNGAGGLLPADFSLEGLIAGFFFSLVGLAYLRYGKKNQKWPVFFCGLALLIYPYFIYKVTLIVVLGLGLSLAPFVPTLLRWLNEAKS